MVDPAHDSKNYLTTKCTKDTKDFEIDTFELLNFVLFVAFVVNSSIGRDSSHAVFN